MNDSSFSRESADRLGELISVVSLDRQEVVEAFLTDDDLDRE
jgi:hypothetical protein